MHSFLHYRGPKPEFSEIQFKLALERAATVDPKSDQYKAASKTALDALARLVLAQSIVEQDEARAAEAKADQDAAMRAERLNAKRAPWASANVGTLKGLSDFWAAAFGASLLSLPNGTNGIGKIADLKAVSAGREWVYAQIPSGHAVVMAAPEVMQRMAEAHNLPASLTWVCNGVEHRLYSAGRARLNLQTPRLTIVSSNSGQAGAVKLKLTGASWTVPPATALPDGKAELPALPAAIVDAFGRYSGDGAGQIALEKYLLNDA